MMLLKRLILVAVVAFMFMGVADAKDLSAIVKDSIAVADTVAASKRVDTAYSNWFDMRGLNTIQFFLGIYNSGDRPDTNWTNDTLFVKWQHGPWKLATNCRVIELDTILTTNSAMLWDEFELLRSDSTLGNWGRVMLIHWDSLEADAPGIVNNVYKYEAKVTVSASE